MARLAAQLPAESRSMRALEPANEWTGAEYLLASIDYSLRLLCWLKTEDGARGANRPEPPETPAARSDAARRARDTDIDDIARALGLA